MTKIATIEQCKQWELNLTEKGYVRYPHPNYNESIGWCFWVKPGYRTYSILWGDKMEQDRISRVNTKYPVPEGSTTYWRMDDDFTQECVKKFGDTGYRATSDKSVVQPISRKMKP